MKLILKKIGILFITFILSNIVSSTITSGIGGFIGEHRNLIYMLSIVLFIIACRVLYSPIKKLIMKEGDMTVKSARNTVLIAILVSIISVTVSFFRINRTFTSDYDRLSEDIQMLDEQCPIKGEDSELSSVKLQDNTLIYNYLFYEYRELTVNLLRDNEQAIKENIIYSLKNDKDMLEQIKNNDINVSIVYVGNRTNERVEFVVSLEDLD